MGASVSGGPVVSWSGGSRGAASADGSRGEDGGRPGEVGGDRGRESGVMAGCASRCGHGSCRWWMIRR